jgi:hypothetical protein
VTVVAGGVEFYHHRIFLCMASPVMDRMLAAKMKESNSNRIELKNMDPDEWLRVYKFLSLDKAEQDKDLAPSAMTHKTALTLLACLDYLGWEECDARASSCLNEYCNRSMFNFPDYQD